MQNSSYINGKTFDQSPIFLMSICIICLIIFILTDGMSIAQRHAFCVKRLICPNFST